MSKRICRKLLTSILCAFSFVGAFAQSDGSYTSYTPYSVFGIGDLYKQGSAHNRGMGGVGIAGRSKRYVNYINPASIVNRDTLSFMLDFGLSNENKIYKQNSLQSANNTFTINDIVFSIPIYNRLAVMGGITPFSSIGYNFSHNLTGDALIGRTGNATYTSEGSGSLYQMFFGAGFKISNRLSIGAEVIYFFGNLQKNTYLEFDADDIRDVYTGYKLELNSFAGKFGIQYEQPLGNDLSLSVGATYRTPSKLNGYVTDYEYASVSSLTDTTSYVVDTLSHGKNVKLAGEIGVGVSLRKGDKWTMEIDYLRSNWTSSGFDSYTGFSNIGTSTFTTTTSQSIRAGFEIVPNRNDIRYYLRRCAYRFGGYFDQAYYKLDGNTVNAYGLTFGVTLPVFRLYNGISVGFDIGRRGSKTGNMTQETYGMIVVGFNIHDLWFQKHRYN